RGPYQAVLVAKGLRESLGATEMIEQPWVLRERRERAPELEPDVDRPLCVLPRIGQALEGLERLLEVRDGLPVGRAPEGLSARLAEVCDRLFPSLTPDGVVCEPLDVLGEAFRVERLDRLADADVEGSPAVVQEALVGHLVGERVLECVG